MTLQKKPEDVLSDLGTTYLTHYYHKPFDVYPPTTAEFKKPKEPKEPKPIKLLKDIHTMSDWKIKMPFTLFHKPKEIIRTDPYEHLQPYEYKIESREEDRKKAQMTRPRLIITPAVALDDVDEEQRNHLIDEIYLTATEKALRSAVPDYNYLVAPFPGTLAHPRPFKLLPLKPPFVSKEWRWETVDWDRQQLRSSCEPTLAFWKKQPQIRKYLQCRACNESATIAALRIKERNEGHS